MATFSDTPYRTICRQCYNDAPADARFCAQCGAAASESFMTVVATPAGGSTLSPAPALAHAEQTRGRWMVVAAVALVALAAIATIGIAMTIVNYRRANTWEQRSGEWEARAQASDERASELDADLTESRNNAALLTIGLDTANADRLVLQGRVDELAGEKASAQDQQRAAESERDSAVYFANLAGDAAIDGAQCLYDVGEALSAIADYSFGSYVDSLISQAQYSCGQFDTSYMTFARAVGY